MRCEARHGDISIAVGGFLRCRVQDASILQDAPEVGLGGSVIWGLMLPTGWLHPSCPPCGTGHIVEIWGWGSCRGVSAPVRA